VQAQAQVQVQVLVQSTWPAARLSWNTLPMLRLKQEYNEPQEPLPCVQYQSSSDCQHSALALLILVAFSLVVPVVVVVLVLRGAQVQVKVQMQVRVLGQSTWPVARLSRNTLPMLWLKQEYNGQYQSSSDCQHLALMGTTLKMILQLSQSPQFQREVLVQVAPSCPLSSLPSLLQCALQRCRLALTE